MTDELNPAPLANGHAEGLGPVPVMGTIPVAPKKRRKRKAKPAAPKVARAPKEKELDPLLREKLMQAAAPAIVSAAAADVSATHSLVDGAPLPAGYDRAARFAEVFQAEPRPLPAPPIKSTWRERFVFSLRRMTGFDPSVPPVRFSTTLTILLCFALVGAAAGVARAVL
jgi:hypothetical protein